MSMYKRYAARRGNPKAGASLLARRAWYDGDGQPSQTPAPTPQNTPAPTDNAANNPPAEASNTDQQQEPKTIPYDRFTEVNKAKRDAEQRAQELAARLEAIENAEKKRKEEELTAQQKWQELADQRAKELEDFKRQYEAERLNNTRLQIAAELNVPPALAPRLQGTNADEIREDAQRLVEALGLNKPPEPQQPTQTQPSRPQPITTTPVPTGSAPTNTDADMRMRRFPRTSSMFQSRSDGLRLSGGIGEGGIRIGPDRKNQ